MLVPDVLDVLVAGLGDGVDGVYGVGEPCDGERGGRDAEGGDRGVGREAPAGSMCMCMCMDVGAGRRGQGSHPDSSLAHA